MKRRQRGRGRSTAEALAAAALLHDHYPIHYTECLLALGSGPLLSVDRARLGGLRLQQFSRPHRMAASCHDLPVL